MVLIHGVVAIITTSIVSFLYLVETECFDQSQKKYMLFVFIVNFDMMWSRSFQKIAI